MKKVAILQSNYIPWKGYFDLIGSVDEFIIYDDMQYTRRDWRNRNRIKTRDGVMWLTIPVEVKGKYYQKIRETKVSDSRWNKKHWSHILHNYNKASFFNQYREVFEKEYMNCNEKYLSEINYRFIKLINDILEIDTVIRWSSEFELPEGKTERLISICKECKADVYVSGPAAKEYFDTELAEKEGISVEWFDYSGYIEYNQLYPPFEHGVSIIDLIFNTGDRAREYMKIARTRKCKKR